VQGGRRGGREEPLRAVRRERWRDEQGRLRGGCGYGTLRCLEAPDWMEACGPLVEAMPSRRLRNRSRRDTLNDGRIGEEGQDPHW